MIRDDRPHPIGIFQSICRIPGNLLNDGFYNVEAYLNRGLETMATGDMVSFEVHDTGEMRKFCGWDGTVRPRLAWSTEHLETRTEPIENAE